MRFLANGAPAGSFAGEKYVCGRSCATYYPSNNAPGVSFRFDKPFQEVEGRTCVSVETSKGFVYLKFNTDNKHKTTPDDPYPQVDGPDGIEHYSVAEILAGLEGKAQVGIVLNSDKVPTYENYLTLETQKSNLDYFRNSIKIYTEFREKLVKKMEGCLLYESPYFYNTIHAGVPVPYLKLYIYDKGMKHAEV